MSAERLAVGDLVRCARCSKWHPAEQPDSGSETDYATRMLFYRCGEKMFYAGQIGATAWNAKAVKSPLELELWRVTKDGRTVSGELHCDADGWSVLIRSNGEALFSRRCQSEAHARYVAQGLHQDELHHAQSHDGELSFSRRCPDEVLARFVANGLKQDHVRTGWSVEK